MHGIECEEGLERLEKHASIRARAVAAEHLLRLRHKLVCVAYKQALS